MLQEKKHVFVSQKMMPTFEYIDYTVPQERIIIHDSTLELVRVTLFLRVMIYCMM